MTKTDIAELVTEQLKQEFERQQKANEEHSKSLKAGLHPMPLPEAKPRPTPEEALALEKQRRSYLSVQKRRMAREDAAWMLLGHKVKPLPEAKPTPEDEFKIQRLSRWLFLFEGRIALGDAAGLLLGLSQTMTEDAKFVYAHKSNARAPHRPVSSDLVTAFTDMRGDIADWRVTSDGKYRAVDLIEWAREKGFVADEVLAAWEAHDQPEAVEPEPQTTQATTGNTPRVERHTTKGKRSDTLTPVIEHAQSICKSLCKDPLNTAEVWGQLHTLTAQKYTVLLHLEGAAVVYTDGDNTKRLTKKMLDDRLRPMRKKLASAT